MVAEEWGMVKLRQRVLIVTEMLAVLAGMCVQARAQSMRPPRVYNPGVYNNTRRQMSRRAAARAAVRKRHRAKAKRRRPPRRVILNGRAGVSAAPRPAPALN